MRERKREEKREEEKKKEKKRRKKRRREGKREEEKEKEKKRRKKRRKLSRKSRTIKPDSELRHMELATRLNSREEVCWRWMWRERKITIHEIPS